jgi:preprotein translocase subunit YajC
MNKLEIFYLVITIVFLVIVMRQKRQRKQDKKKNRDKIVFNNGIEDKVIISLPCLVFMDKTL